jgi:hypothetical protein
MHFLLIPYFALTLAYLTQFQGDSHNARLGAKLVALSTAAMLFAVLAARPLEGDSGRYYDFFLVVRDLPFHASIASGDRDILWNLLNWLVGQLGDAPPLLFGAVLAVFSVVFGVALRRYLTATDASTVIMAYLMFPAFIGYAASGMRQGLALVFLLMAYVQFRRGHLSAWAWLLLAPLWHAGSWLGVGAAMAHQLMCRVIKSERLRWAIVLCVLVGAVLLSASGMNKALLADAPEWLPISANHEVYFSDPEELNYQAGFRIDFLLFSLLPLFTAWLCKSSRSTFSYEGAGWWLSLYITENVVYHLFSFAPFADRFAAFSWFVMPLVVFLQVRDTRSAFYKLTFLVGTCLVNVVLLQLYSGKYLRVPSAW